MDLRDRVLTDLSSSRLKDQGIFSPEKVKKLVIQNQNGEIDASYSIWALLSIQSWIKQFIKE